jgi:hypothetical protein
MKKDATVRILICAVPLNTYKPAARGAGNIIFVQIPPFHRHVKEFFPQEKYAQKVNHKNVLLYKPNNLCCKLLGACQLGVLLLQNSM